MIHEIKMYTDLNEMNLDGFTNLMSVKYEPRHGHFTTNCLEYHDIPMKHYHLVFVLHKNMCIHQRRQWFRCTLHHLLHRRRYCKGNFCLARALSILLYLGGDVELNPGPCQNEIHDELSMPTSAVNPIMDQTGIEGQEYMDSETKKCSTLVMLSACQRKWLDAETIEEHRIRLFKMSENQRLRLQYETEKQRAVRLATLTENNRKRLYSETKEDRATRLATLSEDQSMRLQSESNEDRAARLATLCENQSKRLQSESNEDRTARLATLSENQRKRLQSELTKKLESRLSSSNKWKKTRLINESKQKSTLRLEREKEQARLRMQAWRRQKRLLQVKCNSKGEITSSVPCTSIVSNTKVNVTRISSIYESNDGLESDSLKEVQRESTQSDDSVMDEIGKENRFSQKSEEVDMEVGGSVIESGVVIYCICCASTKT